MLPSQLGKIPQYSIDRLSGTINAEKDKIKVIKKGFVEYFFVPQTCLGTFSKKYAQKLRKIIDQHLEFLRNTGAP